MKLGILATHPIQYYSPLYRELASRPGIELIVYYAHRPTSQQQGEGFGISFEWDLPLLDGYRSVFLENVSKKPCSSHYRGCDTPEIAEIVARERFDAFLVHGWHVKAFRQAMRACRRTMTPLMVRGDSTLLVRRGILRRFARWIHHRHLMKQFDAFLIVGERAREYYQAFGADLSRMENCPHFVDNRRFNEATIPDRDARSALFKQWDISENAVVFLFVGKFITLKRPLDFVRAVANTSSNANRPVVGLMVGHGPLLQVIKTESLTMGAPIQMLGFVNQRDIPNVYAAADVLVLPSAMETWGLVVNEAMACGLTSIVSDQVGCAPDLVIHEQTGFVYPSGDVLALSDYMTRLAENPHLLAKLKNAASNRIQAYSVTAAADGIDRAVTKLRVARSSHASKPPIRMDNHA